MYNLEASHNHKDKILTSLTKRFPGSRFRYNGYLENAKLYCFVVNDFELYKSRRFKIRVKLLTIKYGKKQRFCFAFQSF